MPIAEQENEGSGSPSPRSNADEEEILLSNQSNAFEYPPVGEAEPAEKSII